MPAARKKTVSRSSRASRPSRQSSSLNVDAACPLRDASWIWPEGYMYLHNHFAQFRHDFTLASVPAKAPFFITADKDYRLYVNGAYVCRGPARGYQSHWPYDEVDLHSYLKAGNNWIAVEAYNPGISTFKYLHYTKAGMLCAADWGKVKIRSHRDGWLMRRSPAHRKDTARLSMQLDFQEDADGTKDDRSWITLPVAPTNWVKEYFPPKGQNINCFPFGQPPYDNIEPRGIPMLREDVRVPVGVTSAGVGSNVGDYKNCENISWHWVGKEFPTIAAWEKSESVKTRKTADGLEIVIEPAGTGKFRTVTVDLGKMLVGTLNVAVDGAAGGEILDFQYHQCLRGGIPIVQEPGRSCMVAFASRLRVAPGASAHEFYQVMGIQHISVIARDLTKPLTIKLAWRIAEYPFSMRGSFSCSDETLNRIHEICRHTQQICAADAYVDTPWREQAQWWGDARVQGRNTFYLDGDARLLARGVRSIAGQDAPQGLTYGHAPTCSGWCILPDFSLTWVLTIWDYYWQTGDISLFTEQYDRVREVFGYFETPEARDKKTGLLVYDKRFWLFEDWAELPKDRVPTFLNLWHLYALVHYEKLLTVAGRSAEAKKVRAEIASRRVLLSTKLFDKKSGLFHACLDGKGKPVDAPSVHDQVLASLLGMEPKSRKQMLEKRLLPHLRDGRPKAEIIDVVTAHEPSARDEKMPGAVPSAFWVTYFFDCMLELGYGGEVVDMIRRKWEPMLSTGTTWEGYGWTEAEGGSCSHAWTAHPSYHLVNIFAGITQTAAAWKRVSWKPVVADGLQNASASVPTPQGDLRASWKREGGAVVFRIEIPKGVAVDAELPGGTKTLKKSLTKPGVHEFRL